MGLEMDLTICIMGLVLLVLTVLLSVLCSHCGRRSFELRDTTPEKGPSALVRVVKLEETQDYPIKQNATDFADVQDNPHVTSWRSHLGEPQVQDHSSDNVPGMIPQWKSHLEAQMHAGR
ncbi:hypothetical protein NL108_008360 [Boleophthalmus pectinirostris]|nr:hypothetical protein NL108_008360 [Boleophthalmus pectinirostris]